MGFLEDRRKKRYAGTAPRIGDVISSYDSENNVLTIRIIPTIRRYIQRIEVTVRDYKLRDQVFKLKKRNGNFTLILDAFLDKDYSFSFYLMGKDGKYERVERTMEEIRKSIVNDPVVQDVTKTKEKTNKIKEKPKKEVAEKIKTAPEVNVNKPKVNSSKNTATQEFVPVRRAWPTSSQYAQSLQNPSFSISKSCDPLLNIEFLKNPNVNYPSIIHGAGNFGIVFKYVKDKNQNALKCFTRGSPNIQKRYYEVSKAIGNNNVPSMIPLQFFPDSIRVVNKPKEFFPSVSMGWVNGQTLNTFVVDNLSKPDKLRIIAKNLVDSVISMQASQIAHGDLSSDNVIVEKNGTIHLIDYDGMYVPALEKLGSEELGHESYQHPKRGRYYGVKLDNFSILVIYSSLMALIKNSAYWKYNQNDPDKMLFEVSDFVDPSKSSILKSLKAEGGKLKKLATLIEDFASQTPDWDGFDPKSLIKMK